MNTHKCACGTFMKASETVCDRCRKHHDEIVRVRADMQGWRNACLIAREQQRSTAVGAWIAYGVAACAIVAAVFGK